ncbi:MAG: hypothetical protein JHD16_13965, partial [Solirubrobacteraceae bacterium]|nr:hypothetical protein [Solirubrobacteraceae bacterium]
AAAAPATARAEDYFATPDETRTTQGCLTPATACALGVAMAKFGPAAIGAHSVTLAPGTYDLADINAGATPGAEPGRLVVPAGATVAGKDDAPAPTITSDAAGTVETVRATGGILRNLRVQRTGSTSGAALRGLGLNVGDLPLLIDRVTVDSSGETGIETRGTVLLRSSLVTHTGPAGSAIRLDLTPGTGFATPAPRALGVTALSTNGTGLDAVLDAPSATGYDLTNVLVSSWATRANDPGGSIAATSDRVATMRAPTTSGAVTTTAVSAPLSVGSSAIDAAGLPVPGSPLVDAGVDVALIGTTDLAGGKRITGSAPDIGALERQDGTPPRGANAPAPLPPVIDDFGPITGDGFGDLADTLEPWITLVSKVGKLSRSKLSSKSGLTVKITTDEPAAAKLELVIKVKSKGKSKDKVVGTAEAKVAAAGEIQLKLKIKKSKVPKKGTKATLRFTLTDAAGNVGRLSEPTKLS